MTKRQRKNADLIRLDKQYREWLSHQPSCIDGTYSEWHAGHGRCIACHVRRSRHSGTGWKPPFSAVPMTYQQHVQQHMHGESYHRPLEWFEGMANRYLEYWLRTQPESVREIVMEKTLAGGS